MAESATNVDLIQAVLAAGMIAIGPWFYRHCCRPALAMAGAPPVAFDIVLLCLAGMVTIYTVGLVDSVARLLSSGAGRTLAAIGVLLYVPIALAFLRPSWYVRLGDRDPTAPVRFMLTWLGKEWGKLGNTVRDGPGLLRATERELNQLREQANAALVDEWVVQFEAYLRKSRLGAVSAQRAERQLVERLDDVRPVDRLSRIY
jgi:hypothetical protein